MRMIQRRARRRRDVVGRCESGSGDESIVEGSGDIGVGRIMTAIGPGVKSGRSLHEGCKVDFVGWVSGAKPTLQDQPGRTDFTILLTDVPEGLTSGRPAFI